MVVETFSADTYEQAPVEIVTSKDGTTIGYRRLGQGPGVVLVQGAMGTAYNFKQLAELLSDRFSVYLPDRRGRGMSSVTIGDDYNMQKEVEDLDALLTKTGARRVFGLSAGGIIALQAALTLPAIQKLTIFEPALFTGGAPVHMIARYEQEMAQGKVAAALITGMKAGQLGPPIFNFIPRPLLETIVNLGIKSEDRKGSEGYVPMRILASTLHNDFRLAAEMSGSLDRFKGIQTETLLLNGSKSPAYLIENIAALERILPHAHRAVLAGVGHGAAWNSDRRGSPEIVAPVLAEFFA